MQLPQKCSVCGDVGTTTINSAKRMPRTLSGIVAHEVPCFCIQGDRQRSLVRDMAEPLLHRDGNTKVYAKVDSIPRDQLEVWSLPVEWFPESSIPQSRSSPGLKLTATIATLNPRGR